MQAAASFEDPASAARTALVALAADGPDEMGRELAEGPAAVRATLEGLAGSLPRLRRAIAEAERVVLMGTGASLAVARAAAPLWLPGGGPAPDVQEASAIAFGAFGGQDLRAGDLVILVSKSGGSPETVAAGRLARTRGARVVAVTVAPDSILASEADEVVLTPIGVENGAATKSELAAAAALLALGGATSAADGPSAGALGHPDHMAALWSWASTLGSQLAAARQVWLLGFGSALGVAEAAALLWLEKVRRPAVSMTPSAFRHGPVEAMTEGDAVVIVERRDAGEVERAYLELLAGEVKSLGATLITVAPPAETEAQRVLRSMLQLQQLARAAAHAGGTYQDGFRVLYSVIRPATGLFAPEP